MPIAAISDTASHAIRMFRERPYPELSTRPFLAADALPDHQGSGSFALLLAKDVLIANFVPFIHQTCLL